MLLLLAIPFVTIIGFALTAFYFSSLVPYLQAKKTEETVQRIELVLDLVHELQKERGLTTDFLTSAGQKFEKEMKAQRLEVDKKAQLLPEDLRQRLVAIPEVRKAVDQLETTPIDAFNAYSNAIESLFIYIRESAKNVKHVELFKLLEAQLFLVYAKENAGRERALINSVFTKDVMEASDRDLWYRAMNNQDLYIRAFSDFAPLETVQLYSQKVKDDGVESFRQILREKADFFGVNPEDWFRVSTERMDNMEAVNLEMKRIIKRKSKEITNLALRNGSLFVLFGTPPFLMFLAISFLIIHGITRTTKELSDAIHYISEEGKFDRKVEVRERDELGRMAEDFNMLVDALRGVIEEIREVMLSASQGDFSKRIGLELKGDLLILKEKINRVMEVMGMLVESAISVANASVEISKAMEVVEEGARSQAESTERMASAIEEISSAVEETANSTELASQSADYTYRTVEASANLVEKLRLSMEKVRSEGENIKQVAESIQQVAEQVNLLALNAAIEAARAGEQGRGFAVVADEVRRLANQVSKMAQSVGETVQGVVASIVEGYQSTQEVYESFEKVEESTNKIKEMLQRVAASMEETSASIREIANNLERLKDVGNNNAATAEEVLSKMMELVKVTEDVRKNIESLRE
ncbi:MAG: nitrate- and nitrite sensing domain-containing protein [Aquificaceae bacterium]|nr:nitrate- and nitrite sensing domain-containing protein [Aquificaceae bacterium]